MAVCNSKVRTIRDVDEISDPALNKARITAALRWLGITWGVSLSLDGLTSEQAYGLEVILEMLADAVEGDLA